MSTVAEFIFVAVEEDKKKPKVFSHTIFDLILTIVHPLHR